MNPRLGSLATRLRSFLADARSAVASARSAATPAHLVVFASFCLVAAGATFPSGGAPVAIARLSLALAGGALGAWIWPQLPPGLRRVLDVGGQIAAPLVVTRIGYDIYRLPLLLEKHGAVLDDWAPHHVQVSIVAEAMRHGTSVRWTHLLFAGEPIGDLYPSFGTYVAAWVTNAMHFQNEVPRALALVGAAGVIGIAVGVVLVAQRLVRWPVAMAAGLVALFDDGGAISSGSGAVFVLALYQHALAQALSLFAIAAAIWSVQRPAAWRAVLVWVLAALAMLAHPLSLISLAPFVVGFGVAPLVATDYRFSRAWRGSRDLLVGMLLAAPAWMPLLDNVLRYGLHYGSSPWPPFDIGTAIAGARYGTSTFGLFMSIGFAGVLAGLWSRQVVAVALSVAALAALLLGTDVPFLLGGWGPSPSLARFAAERTQGILRLSLLALAAFTIDRALVVGARGLLRRPHESVRVRLVLGAVAVALGLLTLQMAYPYARERTRVQREAAKIELADPSDFRALVSWMKAQRNPSRGVQRVYFEETHAYPFHLAALARLPVIRSGYAAGTMLRERIDGTTPALLARYDVAWVVRRGGSPSFGDRASERRFGDYRVRAISAHDGRIARIVGGPGRVRALHFDDRRVELELTGTTRPTLVELGISWFPRWRGTQNGHDVPVYAALAAPGRAPRVLAVWLRPGRTTLTPDGPLPSDRVGDLPMAAGSAIALLVLLLAVSRRAKWRSLRLAARALRTVRRRRVPIAAGAACLGAVLLTGAGARSMTAEVLALIPTRVLASDAQVRFLPDEGPARPCTFRWQSGSFECGIEYGRVSAGHIPALNDATASWPFITPAVRVFSGAKLGFFEIVMRRRASGTWLAANWGPTQPARLMIDDRAALTLDLTTQAIELGDVPAVHTFVLVLRAAGVGRIGGAAVVAKRALDVDRTNDVPWAPRVAPGGL